jgi:hypothetical protein
VDIPPTLAMSVWTCVWTRPLWPLTPPWLCKLMRIPSTFGP